MKSIPKSKYTDGHYLVTQAQKCGCEVRRQHGDHVILEKEGQVIVIPDRHIGLGLGRKIVKMIVALAVIMMGVIICAQ